MMSSGTIELDVGVTSSHGERHQCAESPEAFYADALQQT